MSSTGVGIIGCGAISGIYLENLQKFSQTHVEAVADLDRDKAVAKAAEYGVEKVLTPDELLQDPNVSIVLNLTIPAAHYQVALDALNAGKHVYNEKPLSVTREEGQKLVSLAKEKGLRLGCAPDTVMGAGTQTCRDFIDRGDLGEIVGCQGFMMGGGVETWHPNPPFYYQIGGGPLFDMGPYYLSCLVQLLGPVKRVTGLTRISFPVRHITSQPLAGTDVTVETPTHIVSLLEFECGAIGQLTTSFDTMAGTELPNIEVYGSKGTLRVPDPNTFGGEPKLRTLEKQEWSPLDLAYGYAENARGLGVLDMALAIQEGRPHRASGDLAFHVLDIMHAVHESAESGQHVVLSAKDVRPEAMPQSEF